MATLRRIRGLTLQETSARSGVSIDTLSEDESGKRSVPDERFERVVRSLDFALAEAEEVVQVVARRLRAAAPLPHPLAPPPEVDREIGLLALGLGVAIEREVGETLRRDWTAHRAERARARAEELVARLRRHQQPERRLLIERAPEFRIWSLPEALGEESVRALTRKVPAGRAWAALARSSAEAARVPDSWRNRLRAWALAFWANVLRVENEFREADRTWAVVWDLWRSSAIAELPLGEWRLLHLEASLRRDQRLWPRAVELLQQAASTAPSAALARIRLKLASSFNEMGEPTCALTVIEAARPSVAAGGKARERFLLCFTEASSLLALGRLDAVGPLLEVARGLSAHAGWDLDLLRTVWLDGKLALESREGAAPRETFSQVRREFAVRGLAVDAALAGLDEALALLREGSLGAVRELAVEMIPIFRSEAFRGEAFASWRLFYEAAEKELATVELVRQVSRALVSAARAPLAESTS